MKEKIVFIAHSYHKKTKSSDFMVEYLKEFYDVEVVYDDEWETGNKIDWGNFDSKYYAVVVWQVFPENEDFKNIPNQNVIFFPMYDQAIRWKFSKWHECKNFKIINFSLALHKKLQKWGFNSMYIQYFVEPKEFTPGIDDEVFFWQRLTKINIKTVKKLFRKSNIKLHIHKAIDPGQKFISPIPEDEKNFNITYSEWFDTKDEMENIKKTKGIYIAPRYFEGIGMSFLEAMAQGKVVIANNQPTMNEYIKNGETGFLCDFNFPKPIKLLNLEKIQQNTYAFAKKGYENWLLDRKKIIDYINAPCFENELCLWVRICKPLLFMEYRKIIRFKLGKNANLILFGKKII